MGGEFLGAGDKYLPLKFDIGLNTHYGWVRINVNATCTQYIVKDYAYNATAGQMILAGQTVGINDNLISKADVTFTGNQLNVINIEHINTNDLIFSLYDAGGKKIIETKQTTIDTKPLAKGIYIAEILYKNDKIVKKVLIE